MPNVFLLIYLSASGYVGYLTVSIFSLTLYDGYRPVLPNFLLMPFE